MTLAACADDGAAEDSESSEATGADTAGVSTASTGTTSPTSSSGPDTSTGIDSGTADTETGDDGTTSTGPDETTGTSGDETSGDATSGDTTEGSTTGGAAMLPSDPVCVECVAGNRVGFHGMALLGNDHHFLAHIPLFNPPHDMQLAARIELLDGGGDPIVDDFSDGEYSLAPNETFSLDDLGLGLTTEFSADVHDGNFEQGAPVLYPNVTVSVQAVVLARELPDNSALPDGTEEHYLIGTNDEAYLLNFIRNSRAYQQFLRATDVQGAALDPDGAPRVVTASDGPLTGASGTIGSTAGDVDLSLTVEAEIWCLDGPDFFFAC